MERARVDSSSIASIGYDELEKILEIEFRKGSVYEYFAVPLLVYQQLMRSPSKGEFHASKIKGRYQYRKVSD